MAQFAPVMFPRYGTLVFYFAMVVLLIGLAVLIWAVAHRGGDIDSSDKDSDTIIGTDISNDGGGTGMDIELTGTPEQPSVGAESLAHATAGHGVIGTRVVQNGPGVGLKVVQNGPGVGFRSIAVSGSAEKKED